jgi:hypothetical protein
VDGKPTIVRLRKAIYGLKQAGELRAKLLAGYLKEIGFERAVADTCLFVKREADGSRVFILAYVDDLIIVGNSRPAIARVKGHLENRFTMKHQGELTRFLGMTIS